MTWLCFLAFLSHVRKRKRNKNYAFDVMPIEGFFSVLCFLQCTPAEFVAMSKSLVKLMKHVQSNKEVATSKLESPLLRNLFTEVWKIIC